MQLTSQTTNPNHNTNSKLTHGMIKTKKISVDAAAYGTCTIKTKTLNWKGPLFNNWKNKKIVENKLSYDKTQLFKNEQNNIF